MKICHEGNKVRFFYYPYCKPVHNGQLNVFVYDLYPKLIRLIRNVNICTKGGQIPLSIPPVMLVAVVPASISKMSLRPMFVIFYGFRSWMYIFFFRKKIPTKKINNLFFRSTPFYYYYRLKLVRSNALPKLVRRTVNGKET